MIPTFRVIVKEIANKRHVIDYRYVSALSIATDGTVSVTYYDSTFSNYDTDTYDISLYAFHGVPNKTSAEGVRFTEKPKQTIDSLLPLIAVFKYVPTTIDIDISSTALTIPEPSISVSSAGTYTLSISVPEIAITEATITSTKEE